MNSNSMTFLSPWSLLIIAYVSYILHFRAIDRCFTTPVRMVVISVLCWYSLVIVIPTPLYASVKFIIGFISREEIHG